MEKRAKRNTIAVIALFMVLCLNGIGHACLKDGAGGYSGEYILVFSRGVSREEAAQEAASWGDPYRPATVTGLEEQKYIMRLLNGLQGEFRIGGYHKSDNQWRWTTGEPWAYRNLDKERPDFYSTLNVGRHGSRRRWHKEGSHRFILGFIAEKNRPNPNPVPLPPAMMLFGSGLTAVGGLRVVWRKRKDLKG